MTVDVCQDLGTVAVQLHGTETDLATWENPDDCIRPYQLHDDPNNGPFQGDRFDSGILEPGQSFSTRLSADCVLANGLPTAKGLRVPYHCHIRAAMRGQIRVVII